MAKKPASKKNKPAQQPARSTPAKAASKAGKMQFDGSWSLWALLGVSGLIFLIARFKLLAIPLERDEGSFAYIGHWIFRGRELYTDMLDSKLPGLYTYYGVFTSLFGYNATGVHVGLLVANLASVVCFYILLKDVFNKLIAAVACSLFMFMVVSSNVNGFAAHATQLLTPFVIGGFLLFWKGLTSNKLYLFFLAGLCIGIAFTIKQQSAIFGILIALLWWPARLWWNKKENSRLPIMEWLLLGIGGLLPAALVFIYFMQVGRFEQFYDWTVTQPFNLAGAFKEPWYQLFGNVFPKVTDKFEAVWIAAGIGLVLIFFSGLKKYGIAFGAAFGILGVGSVIIGAAYYRHYFVVALPGVALLAACTIYWISKKTGSAGPFVGIAITVLLIMMALSGKTDYYFNPDYAKIHYENYGQNMFPEIEKIGKELKKRMKPGERIGVMGSEPEVLVAADKESCSKHLMVYAILFDPVRSPPMQQEYIQELQTCAPEYIVWNTTTGSWSSGYDRLAFFEQLMQWVEANYETVGLAESRQASPGVLVWDRELDTYKAQNDFKVFVLKKKSTPAAPPG